MDKTSEIIVSTCGDQRDEAVTATQWSVEVVLGMHPAKRLEPSDVKQTELPSQAQTTTAHFSDISKSSEVEEGQNPLKQFSERMKSARKQTGMTQQKLAASVALHPSFIAHLETLKENSALPSYSRTAALERVLGLKLGELWELVEAARAYIALRRARTMQKFKETELQLMGISAHHYNVVPLIANHQKQLFAAKVNTEECEGLLEMLNDVALILSAQPAWEASRKELRRLANQVTKMNS